MVTLAGALVVPGRWLAKVRLGGLSAIAGAVPVPLKATLALGTLIASLLIVSVALRAPTADGVNLTTRVALPPAETLNGAAGEVTAKSPGLAPERLSAETLSAALPVL